MVRSRAPSPSPSVSNRTSNSFSSTLQNRPPFSSSPPLPTCSVLHFHPPLLVSKSQALHTSSLPSPLVLVPHHRVTLSSNFPFSSPSHLLLTSSAGPRSAPRRVSFRADNPAPPRLPPIILHLLPENSGFPPPPVPTVPPGSCASPFSSRRPLFAVLRPTERGWKGPLSSGT